MTVVFVHGLPETQEIWAPLRRGIRRPSVAPSLPGFGVPRPMGFTGTKDAYADWLAREIADLDRPIDLVGHDLGALLVMRVVSAHDVAVRSYVVDVPNLFHPRCVWHERARKLQQPGVGEALLKETREAPPEDPRSTASRLAAVGVPSDLARVLGAAHDETMSRSILDFYRSAVPNVAADWWDDWGDVRARGLVVLMPDPPEIRSQSLEVAKRLGAETTEDLAELNHCWMAEAPAKVAVVLERFWSSVEATSPAM